MLELHKMEMQFTTIEYNEQNNEIIILDQTKLPGEEKYIKLKTIKDVFHAIKNMQVRGAPLIGVSAAYGIVLSAAHSANPVDVVQAADYIRSARPTAVNLSWAVERMKSKIDDNKNLFEILLKEARSIEREDKDACQKMGKFGAQLVPDNAKIMVHCNAGALATSGIGTALGILYTAKSQGKKFEVYSCETRPLLQGARLTSWELTKNNIKTYTICDNMAATYMPDMDFVLVGADRIARNGDTANKIGTRGLAIIAQYYNVSFYVAAPMSTFDFNRESGTDIPIEIRCEDEVRKFNERGIVAAKAYICNPAFDVTPSILITGIITEKGIITPPYEHAIQHIK
jgi:methylthioribose-1-phosphate isomerase